MSDNFQMMMKLWDRVGDLEKAINGDEAKPEGGLAKRLWDAESRIGKLELAAGEPQATAAGPCSVGCPHTPMGRDYRCDRTRGHEESHRHIGPGFTIHWDR